MFAADVAAVIAAIDDHPGPLEGTWGIEGPDVVSADELVAILRADDASPTHADGQPAAAALTKLLETPVDAVTASFFAMPSRADRPDAAAAFGVRTTPLLEGLRATLTAAGAHDDARTAARLRPHGEPGRPHDRRPGRRAPVA